MILSMILSAAGAFAICFGLNTLLKLPFSEAFLDSAGLKVAAIDENFDSVVFVCDGRDNNSRDIGFDVEVSEDKTVKYVFSVGVNKSCNVWPEWRLGGTEKDL